MVTGSGVGFGQNPSPVEIDGGRGKSLDFLHRKLESRGPEPVRGVL